MNMAKMIGLKYQSNSWKLALYKEVANNVDKDGIII